MRRTEFDLCAEGVMLCVHYIRLCVCLVKIKNLYQLDIVRQICSDTLHYIKMSCISHITDQATQNIKSAFIKFIVADFETFNICDLSIHSGHLPPYDLEFLQRKYFLHLMNIVMLVKGAFTNRYIYM